MSSTFAISGKVQSLKSTDKGYRLKQEPVDPLYNSHRNGKVQVDVGRIRVVLLKTGSRPENVIDRVN